MPAKGTSNIAETQRLKIARLRSQGVPLRQVAEEVGLSPRTIPVVATDPRTKSMMYQLGARLFERQAKTMEAVLAQMVAAFSKCKTAREAAELGERIVGVCERFDLGGRAILELEAKVEAAKSGIGEGGGRQVAGVQFQEVLVAVHQRLAERDGRISGNATQADPQP